MQFQIRTAERKQAKLRAGIFGPSGSGKTMSALKMAKGLVGEWEKIIIIDTENKSADLYSHLGPYRVLTLTKYDPESYIDAIAACEQAGAEVIIIDSITHEWNGPGGILELSDAMAKDAKSSFLVWSKLTPRHNAFINRILMSSSHIICCGRSKQDYALNQTEKNGKTVNVPEKIGMKAITREGFDYEMTISFELAISHYATSTKDRTGLFQDKPEHVIDESTGEKLAAWNASGAPDTTEQKKEIVRHLLRLGKYSHTDDVENNKKVITDAVMELTQLTLEPQNFPTIMQKLSLTNIEPKEAAIVEPSAPHATTTPITTPAEVENEAAEEVAMAGNGQIMMLRTLLKSRENIAMSDLPGIVSYMRAALNKPDLLELTQLTKAEVEKVIKLLEKQPAKNDASNNA